MAAIAIPRLTGFQETARKKADLNNARMLVNAASIAIAENKAGVTVVSGTTLDSTDLTGYLDAWPNFETTDFAGDPLYLKVDGDNISVLTADDGVEVYPETDDEFK